MYLQKFKPNNVFHRFYEIADKLPDSIATVRVECAITQRDNKLFTGRACSTAAGSIANYVLMC